VDLSGGEWQKMALARAYLRDAQLLILDEPTAALDAKAEHEVFQRFAELTQGKNGAPDFASIFNREDGGPNSCPGARQIAEQGDHQELLLRGGRYAEMFELQAASYR